LVAHVAEHAINRSRAAAGNACRVKPPVDSSASEAQSKGGAGLMNVAAPLRRRRGGPTCAPALWENAGGGGRIPRHWAGSPGSSFSAPPEESTAISSSSDRTFGKQAIDRIAIGLRASSSRKSQKLHERLTKLVGLASLIGGTGELHIDFRIAFTSPGKPREPPSLPDRVN